MTEKKSFTGWVERPLWERAMLAVLITACVIGLLIVLAQR